MNFGKISQWVGGIVSAAPTSRVHVLVQTNFLMQIRLNSVRKCQGPCSYMHVLGDGQATRSGAWGPQLGKQMGLALFNGAMGTDLELTGPENPTWPHFGR